jgi:hypothetical protein
MMRTKLIIITLLFATLLIASLAGYLVLLAVRTKMFSRATSIGLDVIIMFHVLSAIASSFFWLISRVLVRYRRPIQVGLIISLMVWGAFLALNVTGHFWFYKKAAEIVFE